MIDWPARVRQLQQMAEELDGLSRRATGPQQLALGRIADELAQFARQIARVLEEEAAASQQQAAYTPDWMVDTDGAGYDAPPEEYDEAGPDQGGWD
jgi:hypothetical protein